MVTNRGKFVVEKYIADETAYDLECSGIYNGDDFTSEAEVRDYFTVESFEMMMSEPCDWSQEYLDYLAQIVINNKIKCDF